MLTKIFFSPDVAIKLPSNAHWAIRVQNGGKARKIITQIKKRFLPSFCDVNKIFVSPKNMFQKNCPQMHTNAIRVLNAGKAR